MKRIRVGAGEFLDLDRRLCDGLLASAVLVAALLGVASSGVASARRDAGAPFLAQALALARGDAVAACGQYSQVFLVRHSGGRSLAAARRLCPRVLRSELKDLDLAKLRRFASTRLIRVRVEHTRARVTVQTRLYGLQPIATGTAVLEHGRWKILEPLSGDHVGRLLLEDVPSASMAPTLPVGTTILVDRDAYLHAAPAIGDIVVFHPPLEAVTDGRCTIVPPSGQACAAADRRAAKDLFVKRIVAGPEDRISIPNGQVIRNGVPASENFIKPCDIQSLLVNVCNFPRAFTVMAGRYYVLGDNRGTSDDSRFWGPIAAPAIVGRARRLGP